MLKRHLNSYKYALKGIWLAFRHERHMAFHLVAALVVLATNCILGIHKTEWMITLLLIALVWTAEIFNTAIEKLADRVTMEFDPLIGQVKDLASGAVLILCFAAVICALMIYIPYIIVLLA